MTRKVVQILDNGSAGNVVRLDNGEVITFPFCPGVITAGMLVEEIPGGYRPYAGVVEGAATGDGDRGTQSLEAPQGESGTLEDVEDAA